MPNKFLYRDMTQPEFRRALVAAGITDSDAQKLFGRHRAAFVALLDGSAAPAPLEATIIELLARRPELVDEVMAIAESRVTGHTKDEGRAARRAHLQRKEGAMKPHLDIKERFLQLTQKFKVTLEALGYTDIAVTATPRGNDIYTIDIHFDAVTPDGHNRGVEHAVFLDMADMVSNAAALERVFQSTGERYAETVRSLASKN